MPNEAWAVGEARALMHTQTDPQQIRDALNRAIEANPMAIVPRRTLAEVEASLPQPDLQSFREQFEQVLKIDPNDVQARLSYAQTLADRFNQRAEAAEQYRKALEYNDQLSPDEPKRLTPQQVERVQARMRELGA